MPPRHGTLTLLPPSPRHPPNLSAHAYQAFHELEAAVATLHRGSAACAAAQQPERAAELRMMAKPKKDGRSWLPRRSSPYARELDVALMLVSRAAGAIEQPVPIANLVTQALVSDGLASEFPGDTLIAEAPEAAAVGDAAALELINELGATNPCVNNYIDSYPEPVPPTTLDPAGLGAALERSAATVGQPLSPRTWLLAPITG